jgi:hypothetical protein
MKINPWTLGLAAAGVVTLASAVQAEEATESVMTMVSSTTLSGYVNTSVNWTPGPAAGFRATTFGGAAKNDGFNLDVVSLTVSKPLDEGEWSAGYKAQVWFGPDANALGTQSTLSSVDDFNIKNAYVALRAPVGNGIDFKLGVFDTIIGYESTDAPNNPNYTRSIAFTVEPTQHTGLLASYRFNDVLAISAGIANTPNAVINGRGPGGVANQTRKTYLAAITLTAPDSLGFLEGGTLTAGIVEGRSSAVAIGGFANDRDVRNLYVGATVPTPLEGLKVGLAWDHIDRDPTSDTPVPTAFTSFQYDTDVFGAYLSYQATEKVKLNTRVEYADLGANNALTGAGFHAGAAAPAGATEIVSTTFTVDYSLWENVISRLEYRWDRDVSGGRHFLGNTGAATHGNSSLIALNVIYKF